MDKQISKNTVPAEESDDGEAKRELKPEQPITDKDSGKGTTSSGKSSGSVSQASDSTSGVELKNEVDEQPLIPVPPMSPQPSTSGATAGVSPNNSRKKSPAHKVQEGLSWVRNHLSPKKKSSSCNLESSGGLKVGSSPKKSSRNSRRNSPQNSPIKSPQKISKKPSFRQKFKSPSKKRESADESKPFLEDDELRQYSTSDEDQTGVKDQASKKGAIPKTRRSKKSTDQSPKHKSAEFKKKDRKLSEKAATEARQKLKDKVNKSIAKKIPPAKTAALNDFENFQRFPKAPKPEVGTWSYPRCTTDDGTTTGTPSEVDLSSMSSYKIDEFSDQSLSRGSPAVERNEGGLDVLNNNVPEAAVEHSINSAAEQLARSLNFSDTAVSSGGGSAAAQMDDIAGSSSGPVPESDSGRRAELGNGGRRNPSNSQYTSNKSSSKLKEIKSQSKKDEETEDDSDESS